MTAPSNAAPAPCPAPCPARAPHATAPDAAAAPAGDARSPRMGGWSVAIATLLFGLRGLPVPTRPLPDRRAPAAATEPDAARDEGEQP